MARKIKAAFDFDEAESQIKELQIPYEYDTKEYPIEVLLFKFKPDDRENSNMIIPGYQREFIWPDKMKARFIESLLLGVPIQPLFAAILDEDGRLEIIDGSQRLRTIDAFMHDEFKLSNLQKLTALNGVKYSEFTSARKNKFNLLNVRVNVITEKADLSIRQDIFNRINTSGVQANKSEVRKGAFGGFYEFITECSKNLKFIQLCPITDDAKKRGEAEELILRFFTYSDYGVDRKERGSKLLDTYLIEKNKKAKSVDDYQYLSIRFNRMLDFVERNFPFGFRKIPSARSTPRVRFEAISVGSHFALEQAPNLIPAYMDWLESKEFEVVTTSDSAGNPGKLKARVNFVTNCLLDITKRDELTYAEGQR
ncbi:MAG: DUF262 domain-containing protein [Bacteroidota bacterium]|nr:DUF262 domain-containing protein [Bacteroidota bacterium]